MSKYLNRDDTTEIFRLAVLDALDKAAVQAFPSRPPTNGLGANDADLTKLFAYIDYQVLTLASRYGYVLVDEQAEAS